jgi:hypothetical protein
MNSFIKGVVTGTGVTLLILFLIFAALDADRYNREAILLQEQQNELQELYKDYSNRDPYEFLDTPGVRGAADGANEEFIRKRDEALYRIRGGHTD